MDKRLKEAFDSVTMPDHCSEKIENALREHESRKILCNGCKALRVLAVAASLFFVLAVIISIPGVASALELTALAISEAIEVIFSDYVLVSDGSGEVIEFRINENGIITETAVDTYRIFPDWLIEADGRLYFVGNSEYIDITDSFTKDEPFTYVYQDKFGTKYCYAVGGEFDPEKHIADSVMGWFEFTVYVDHCSGGGSLNDFIYFEPETTWVYKLEKAWGLQITGLGIHFDELWEFFNNKNSGE